MDIKTKILAFAARGKGQEGWCFYNGIKQLKLRMKAKKLGRKNSAINQDYYNRDASPFEVFMINVKIKSLKKFAFQNSNEICVFISLNQTCWKRSNYACNSMPIQNQL